MSVAMSGNDGLVINNRIFSDFATGTWGELTFPNEIAAVKTGKNKNTIYGQNQTGDNANMTIALIRGSGDDKFLNGLLANQNNNFPGFPLMQGSYTKKVGDGNGKIINDVYSLSGGVFVNNVEAKSNAEGDTDQSMSVYKFRWSSAPRAIG